MTAELPVGLAARLRVLVGFVGVVLFFLVTEAATAQSRFFQWPRVSITSPVSGGSYRTDQATMSLAGTATDNARALSDVLEGSKGAFRDVAVLNAAAGLIVAGRAKDLGHAVALAQKSIDAGEAIGRLQRLIQVSNV